MSDSLSAKEARQNSIAFMQGTDSLVLGKFFDWVTQESNEGNFGGTLPAESFKFTTKELNYLRKMGYRVLLEKTDVKNWRVDW